MTSWKIGIDNATLFPYCFIFTLFELFSQSIYWLLDRNLATHRINDFFGLHLNYGKLPGQQRQRISRALREDIIINSWKRKANVKIQWGFQLEYNVRLLREIRGGIDTNLSKFTLKYFYEKKDETNTNRTWSSDGLAPPPSPLPTFPTVSDHEIQRSELRLLVENVSLSQVLDYAAKSFLYCTWEFKIYHLLDFIYRFTTFKVTSNICTFRVWVKRTSSSGFSVKTRTCKQTQQK